MRGEKKREYRIERWKRNRLREEEERRRERMRSRTRSKYTEYMDEAFAMNHVNSQRQFKQLMGRFTHRQRNIRFGFHSSGDYLSLPPPENILANAPQRHPHSKPMLHDEVLSLYERRGEETKEEGVEISVDRSQTQGMINTILHTGIFSNLNATLNHIGTHPTQAENFNSMKYVTKYKYIPKQDTTSNTNIIESCSICLEEFIKDDNLVLLPCIHSFHEECIKRWLSEKDVCPLCKCSVLKEGIREKIEENDQIDSQAGPTNEAN